MTPYYPYVKLPWTGCKIIANGHISKQGKSLDI